MLSDESLKKASLGQSGQQDCTQAYGLQENLCSARRPSLTESIKSRIYHSQRESQNLLQLNELDALLEKHPDVARILDLIEATNR